MFNIFNRSKRLKERLEKSIEERVNGNSARAFVNRFTNDCLELGYVMQYLKEIASDTQNTVSFTSLINIIDRDLVHTAIKDYTSEKEVEGYFKDSGQGGCAMLGAGLVANSEFWKGMDHRAEEGKRRFMDTVKTIALVTGNPKAIDKVAEVSIDSTGGKGRKFVMENMASKAYETKSAEEVIKLADHYLGINRLNRL